MKKINEEKWKRLKSFEDILNEEVGCEDSPERTEFEARAKAYYYAETAKGTAQAAEDDPATVG